MESLSHANSEFALNLYRAISAQNTAGDIFFSPLSISAAMCMVYLGARGVTAEEMAKVQYDSLSHTQTVYKTHTICAQNVKIVTATVVLGVSSIPDVHNHFKTLNSEINSPKVSYILRLANRIYGEKTLHFLSEFVDSTQKQYQADMQAVDFIGSSEKSRKLINHWVKEKTEGKIKDILQPGTVTAMTRLSIVNAIYFKGKWKHVFKKKNTKKMPFKINQNRSKPVQMMFQTNKFPFNYIDEYKLRVLDLPYVDEELSMVNRSKPVQMMFQTNKFPFNYIDEYKLRVLDLPYVDEELSMVVLLPEESNDGSDPLLKLESELTMDKLLEWTNKEKMDTWTDIVVYLPKLNLEEQYSLKELLNKMGMSSLFDPNSADLTGISSQGGFFVSSVTHKAFVEVNEEGTEAAAATGGLVECGLPRHELFMADHPFLFFIRHNPTKSILFFGRFRGPK
ncbi:serpin peptidase inhibitor, clade B (ovalbumin), member 1 [Silurus meridionalis]|nr:serpin peptidase inhibitor, clade B (ovalbumin), member 1 [Silurus meridionalis]